MQFLLIKKHVYRVDDITVPSLNFTGGGRGGRWGRVGRLKMGKNMLIIEEPVAEGNSHSIY